MSRTRKDRPYRVCKAEYSAWGDDMHTATKKRKHCDTEYHWMATPSWWTHMFMVRPRRSRENQSLKMLPEDLEDFDFVDTKRKPHKYYW